MKLVALLLLVCVASATVKTVGDPVVVAHDFLEGFFDGLRRDGGKEIDHLPDPMKYFDVTEIQTFITGVEDLLNHFEPLKILDLIQKGTAIFVKLKMAIHDIGDIKNSEMLKKFIDVIISGDWKRLLNLVLDPVFQQDLTELVLVFKAMNKGEADWRAVGTKMGELVYTIITHVAPGMKYLRDDPKDWVMQAEAFLEGFFKAITGGKNPMHLPDPTKYINKKVLEAFVDALENIFDDPFNSIFGIISNGMILFSGLKQAVAEMGSPEVAAALEKFMNDLIDYHKWLEVLPKLVLNPQFINDVKEVVAAFKCFSNQKCDLGVVGTKIGELLECLIEIFEPTKGMFFLRHGGVQDDWVMQAEAFLENFFKAVTGGKNPMHIPDPTKYIDKTVLKAFVDAISKITEDPFNAIFSIMSNGMILFQGLEKAVAEMGSPEVAANLEKFLLDLVDYRKWLDVLPKIATDPKFINDIKEVVSAFKCFSEDKCDLGVVGLKIGEFTNTLINLFEPTFRLRDDPSDWVMQATAFLENFFKAVTGGNNPMHIPDPTKYIDKQVLKRFVDALDKFFDNPLDSIFEIINNGMILFQGLKKAVDEMGSPEVAAALEKFMNDLIDYHKWLEVLPKIATDPKFINDIKEVVDAWTCWSDEKCDLGVVGLKLGNFVDTLINLFEPTIHRHH